MGGAARGINEEDGVLVGRHHPAQHAGREGAHVVVNDVDPATAAATAAEAAKAGVDSLGVAGDIAQKAHVDGLVGRVEMDRDEDVRAHRVRHGRALLE